MQQSRLSFPWTAPSCFSRSHITNEYSPGFTPSCSVVLEINTALAALASVSISKINVAAFFMKRRKEKEYLRLCLKSKFLDEYAC